MVEDLSAVTSVALPSIREIVHMTVTVDRAAIEQRIAAQQLPESVTFVPFKIKYAGAEKNFTVDELLTALGFI